MRLDPHKVRSLDGHSYDDVWWYEDKTGMQIVVRGKPGESARQTVCVRWRDIAAGMKRAKRKP